MKLTWRVSTSHPLHHTVSAAAPSSSSRSPSPSPKVARPSGLTAAAALVALAGLWSAPAAAQEPPAPPPGAATAGSGETAPPEDGTPADGTAAEPGALMTADGTWRYAKADWPRTLVLRPLTLARGMVEVTLDLRISLITNMGFDFFEVLPGVAYGLTDDLTLSVGTDRAPVNFLLGGQGFCLGDCLFDENVRGAGFGAMYTFLRRPNWVVAADAGLELVHFLEENYFWARAGVSLRYQRGKLAWDSRPVFFVGESTDMALENTGWLQITPRVAAGLGVDLRTANDFDTSFFTVRMQVFVSLAPRWDLLVALEIPAVDETSDIKYLRLGGRGRF